MTDRMDFPIGINNDNGTPWQSSDFPWFRDSSGKLVFKNESVEKEPSDRSTSDAAEPDEKDLNDHTTDRAVEQAKPVIQKWLKTVQTWLKARQKEGLTPEQIKERLPELYPLLKSRYFAKLVNQSMQLTYLGARAEVLDETEGELDEDRSDRPKKEDES